MASAQEYIANETFIRQPIDDGSNLQVGDDLGEKRTRVRLCGSASLENEVSE
jgi:hypothetical protein